MNPINHFAMIPIITRAVRPIGTLPPFPPILQSAPHKLGETSRFIMGGTDTYWTKTGNVYTLSQQGWYKAPPLEKKW